MKASLSNRLPSLRGYFLCALVVFLIGCDRAVHTPSTPSDELEQFDGAINNSDSTFDIAKSELYVRASQFLQDGDLDAAKSLYRKAVEAYPDDAEGYAALGACLYFDHKHDEARQQYLLALKLDDKCLSAYYGLGCVAYEQEHYDDAIKQLRKAIGINANDGDSHRVLGMVFDALGDRSQAKFHFERAR